MERTIHGLAGMPNAFTYEMIYILRIGSINTVPAIFTNHNLLRPATTQH